MGPRSFDRGNSTSCRAALPISRLQWGRGLLTAETGPNVGNKGKGEKTFNGAAVF